MYAIQSVLMSLHRVWQHTHEHGACVPAGTASDVSFLIDFLPAYLFPFDERHVEAWMLSGISLGGHATWIVLKNGPVPQFTMAPPKSLSPRLQSRGSRSAYP